MRNEYEKVARDAAAEALTKLGTQVGDYDVYVECRTDAKWEVANHFPVEGVTSAWESEVADDDGKFPLHSFEVYLYVYRHGSMEDVRYTAYHEAFHLSEMSVGIDTTVASAEERAECFAEMMMDAA